MRIHITKLTTDTLGFSTSISAIIMYLSCHVEKANKSSLEAIRVVNSWVPVREKSERGNEDHPVNQYDSLLPNQVFWLAFLSTTFCATTYDPTSAQYVSSVCMECYGIREVSVGINPRHHAAR
ncbi:hypothetical protein Trydic_g7305 [Trypoxylus dichotomus]